MFHNVLLIDHEFVQALSQLLVVWDPSILNKFKIVCSSWLWSET